MSNEGRDNADVPLKVDLPLATSKKADQRYTPQYKNVYFQHDSQSQTQEQLDNDII